MSKEKDNVTTFSLSVYGDIVDYNEVDLVNEPITYGIIEAIYKKKSLGAGYITYATSAGEDYIITRGYIDDNLGTGIVQIQDIFFAAHALLITLITIIQILYFYDPSDKDQKVSNITITIILVMIWGAILLVIVENGFEYYDPHVKENRKYIFNSLVYLGWCKVVISLIKYIPQVVSNFRRRSTIGWNIHNILLDFTGGAFSFGQNIIDSFRDEFSITSDDQSKGLNIAKYALSIISMLFDIVFMVQHYILFKNSNSDLGPAKLDDEIVDRLINSNRESSVK